MLPSPLLLIAASSVAPFTTSPFTTSPFTTSPEPSPSVPSSSGPAGGLGNSVSLQLPAGNVALVDDTGSIFVGVPDSWSDTDLAPIYVAAIGADVGRIVAAPDRQALAELTGPGLEFVALPYLDDDAAELAERYGMSERTEGDDAGEIVCADITEAVYEDPVFTGTQFIGTECGDHGATWYLIIAAPEEHDFTVVVDVKTLSPADEEAYATILATFNLTDIAVPPTPEATETAGSTVSTVSTETPSSGVAEGSVPP